MSLSYQIWNHKDSSETAVLAVPAFPLICMEWEQVASLIPEIPVIAVNHPGIGSTLGGAVPTVDFYAKELIDLGQQLGFKKLILAGNSMGGYVVQAAAHAYPELVKGLVLAGTKAVDDDQETQSQRLKTGQSAVETGDLSRVFHGVDSLVAPDFITTHLDLMGKLHDWITLTSPAGVKWCQTLIANRPNQLQKLGELSVEAAVLFGSYDTASTLSQAKQMAQALRVEPVIIPDAGHLIPVEKPEILAETIAAIYKRINS